MESGAAEPRVVAAFDFDGTLTRRDSFVRFIVRTAGAGRIAMAAASGAPTWRSRNAFKAHLVDRTFRGRRYDELVKEGRAYGDELVDHGLVPALRERVEWHRREGHDVAIVSASLHVYLDRVAERLDVPTVLATSLEVDELGLCTGRLLGANCRGPEKLRRIEEQFGATGYELWAYGDSRGDDEMLAAALHPHRIRHPRLRTRNR